MFELQKNRKIPVVMGTQHPDNAGAPFFQDDPFIASTKEAEEVFLGFSELGLDEFMWDWEGKFADEALIEKLLSSHHDYFKQKGMGRDVFVTLRVPNIWEEKSFKLARAYMGVLSAAEFAKSYDLPAPPVLEFILPMTKSADQLLHVQKTFQKTAQLHQEIFKESDFGQGYIQMIPLFESVEDLSHIEQVLHPYLDEHQAHFGFLPNPFRVFIARSDPALNAGLIPAVLASRLALRQTHLTALQYGIEIAPIIGTGALPFRGGINPENIEQSLAQYKGARTLTVQSAFRYDYPREDVERALVTIRETLNKNEHVEFQENEVVILKKWIERGQVLYRETIEKMAPLINEIAREIPRRRERVQHVGLFGYNRGVGEVTLPRVITFTAALYSLGLPPEFIATGRLLAEIESAGELELIERHFFTLRHELSHAGKFLNRENLEWLKADQAWARDYETDVQNIERIFKTEIGPKKPHHFLHRNLSSNIFLKWRQGESAKDDVAAAAVARKSLG